MSCKDGQLTKFLAEKGETAVVQFKAPEGSQTDFSRRDHER